MDQDPPALPDRALLIQAFARIGGEWEGGLDENLAHPIRGRLLVSYARSLALGRALPAAPTPENPPSRGFPYRPHYARPLQGLDQKRLAAGEKDEDSGFD